MNHHNIACLKFWLRCRPFIVKCKAPNRSVFLQRISINKSAPGFFLRWRSDEINSRSDGAGGMPYMSLLWCRPQRSSRLQNPLKRGARVQDSRRRDLKVGQHPGAPAGLISAPLYTDLSVKGQTLAAFENMSSPPTLGLIVDSIPAIKKYVLEWRILH